eukprot:767327-Hanusia_phi.AAC.3
MVSGRSNRFDSTCTCSWSGFSWFLEIDDGSDAWQANSNNVHTLCLQRQERLTCKFTTIIILTSTLPQQYSRWSHSCCGTRTRYIPPERRQLAARTEASELA